MQIQGIENTMPAEIANDFELLANSLRKHCRGKFVYYLPNPGNWGDGLIREGTLRFLRDHKFKFREIEFRRRSLILPRITGGVVLYGGGGGWCNTWSHSERIVSELSKRWDVFVLPSSFEGVFDIPRVHFYRRDNFESKEFMPTSSFCHDMAFYLSQSVAPSIGDLEKTAYFFRRDKERAPSAKDAPSASIDLSALGNHLTPTEDFFKHIMPYGTIHTDRLHVAIAACILGKTVKIYPSSYFKIRAVFRSSIAPYFPNASLESW